MKVNWSRELSTCAQYFLFSFVAATTALLYQAAYDYDRTNDLNDGLISCFAYSEVLKGAGVYYEWLLGLFPESDNEVYVFAALPNNSTKGA